MEEAGYLVAGGDPQTVKLEPPGSRRAEGCDGKMVSKNHCPVEDEAWGISEV